VLELVEGPTLADRIAEGPLPLDEAMPFAKQIAEALEAAHEQGIIHRDLKTANIKLKPDGTVKVLDFGLAKALAPVAAGASAGGQTFSPTITSPAMTQAGVILGTAAYMAPEQAKGREADKRSDVWAFGAVLFEMLTGRRAFDGEDMTDVLGAVVRLEPDWALLPADVPPAVRTLIQRCLVKDRRLRVSDISAARFVLNELGNIGASRHCGAGSFRLAPDTSSGPGCSADGHHRRRWRVDAAACSWSAPCGAVLVPAAGRAVLFRYEPAGPRDLSRWPECGLCRQFATLPPVHRRVAAP